ncbi:MAG: dTDP-glucose 4,6-dehydratase [Chloroflexota bacterium]|nr:MAG: dTDP-glucose 4,6-dehydratase [Chloroflexota bacterium]
MKTLLVTGGAGFIGSHFVRHILGKYPEYRVVNLDALKYAGNLDNLLDVADDPRYRFVHGDIADAPLVEQLLREYQVSAVVNFAAETHVDRSLLDAGGFILTDVHGTYVLLEAARRAGVERFLQVGTDEVYGHVEVGSTDELSPLTPRSPYSASKAGGDLMVLAYHTSYGLPVVITRASNNLGPNQYPEKFIPLFVTNAIDDEPLPLYGDGMQVRDWLYVVDHCEALDLVLHQGQVGEVYNVGGGNEKVNMEVAHRVLDTLGKSKELIKHVADRPGHDRRYSLDCAKLHALGWRPRHDFETALDLTLRWYVENEWWWRKIKTGEYMEYYRQQYQARLEGVRG